MTEVTEVTEEQRRGSLDGDSILGPAASVAELAVEQEALVWRGGAAIPVHLNASGALMWWHLDGVTPLRTVAEQVAEIYNADVNLVRQSLGRLVSELDEQDLIETAEGSEVNPRSNPSAERAISTDPVRERSTVLHPRTTEWLEHQAVHRWSVQAAAGHSVAIGANSDAARKVLTARLGEPDGCDAPLRLVVVDGGDWDTGERWWLLSDACHPLAATDDLSALEAAITIVLREVEDAAPPSMLPLRFGTVVRDAGATLVSWDLLSARPVLSAALAELGYSIRPSQVAVVDSRARCVRVEEQWVPIERIVVWSGAGALAVPQTPGDWAWTLAVHAASDPDAVIGDRQPILDAVASLVDGLPLHSLTDPGPSALLELLGKGTPC